VEDFFFYYIKPQETGNRGDVRWVVLNNDAASVGAFAAMGKPLLTSLSPYTRENVADSRHTIDLEPAGMLFWNLDAAQAGLGGDDSWSPRTHPEYQLLERSYALTFNLSPMGAATARAAVQRAKQLRV